MKINRWLALSLLVVLVACQKDRSEAEIQDPAEIRSGFSKLLDEYYDGTMALDPLIATSAGDGRFNAVFPNYLSTETDCRTIVAGVNIARKIAQCAPLSSKISEEFRPHASLDINDYDATLDWARNNTASIYHPTGTCKMCQGKDAVVDERLRVHGIRGLRVADCSIMPEIVSGNTNAPAIMIGEKASIMLIEDRAQPI